MKPSERISKVCLSLVTHGSPATSGDLSLRESPFLFYSMIKLFIHLLQLSFDYSVLHAIHVPGCTNVTEFYAFSATLFSDVGYLGHLTSPIFFTSAFSSKACFSRLCLIF